MQLQPELDFWRGAGKLVIGQARSRHHLSVYLLISALRLSWTAAARRRPIPSPEKAPFIFIRHQQGAVEAGI